MTTQSETAPADTGRGSDDCVQLPGERDQNSQSLDDVQGLGGNRLVVLASEIKSEHANALTAAKTSLGHAIAAGTGLIEAKELVPHGKWLPWLANNIGVSERTAQVYMRIARLSKSATVADLTIRAAAGASGHSGSPRLVPLSGHHRIGEGPAGILLIVPSNNSTSTVYITLVKTVSGGGIEAFGLRKPIKISHMEFGVEQTGGDVSRYRWRDEEGEPWTFNEVLFHTHGEWMQARISGVLR